MWNLITSFLFKNNIQIIVGLAITLSIGLGLWYVTDLRHKNEILVIENAEMQKNIYMQQLEIEKFKQMTETVKNENVILNKTVSRINKDNLVLKKKIKNMNYTLGNTDSKAASDEANQMYELIYNKLEFLTNK